MADRKKARGVPREKPQLIADELRSLIVERAALRGRLARPRARAGRAVRRVAAVAARGATDPRGRGSHLGRARRPRRRGRPRARRAHDGPHRRARAPGPAASRWPTCSRPAARWSPRRRGRSRCRRRRRSASKELIRLIDRQEACLDDPEAFGVANAKFHERLVALAGNQTLSIVAEMLNEIVARAVTEASQAPGEESDPDPPTRHPVAAPPGRADRGGRRGRGRGALAGPPGRGGPGAAGPAGDRGSSTCSTTTDRRRLAGQPCTALRGRQRACTRMRVGPGPRE